MSTTHHFPDPSRKLLGTALVVCAALAACGGGAGNSGEASADAADAADVSASSKKSALSVSATSGTSSSAVAATGMVKPVSAVMSGQGWVSSSPSEDVVAKQSYSPVYSGQARHVDLTSGNDANPGTLAAPWKTFAPVAKLKMAAGDALLLKCGEVWRSALELTHLNAPMGNVLVGGYGDCSGDRRPIIRASDWVAPTGWSKVMSAGREIYAKTYTQPVNRLFLASKPLIKARFPNYKRVGEEYALTAQAPANPKSAFRVSAADLAQMSDKDVVGSAVYVKVKQWETLKAVVRAFDASTGIVTLDREMPFAIMPNSGYILEGKPWMLDAAGEWIYDPAAKKLFMWSPNDASPASLEGLEASWRPFGLTAKWIKGLRVERLAVEQQVVDGFELLETNEATLTDVKARHVQELGISALTAPRTVIQDSFVEAAGRTGIIARESDFAKVIRNRVIDTGGHGRADGSDAAIAIFGQGAVAENNLVERSASLGIRFANRPNVLVRGNTVVSFCVRFTDCAGIYTYTGGALANSPTTYVAGALVEANMVMSAKSNLEGCGYSCTNMALGIYLDELSSGVTLSGNTVSDTEVGIGMLNSNFNRVAGNTVRGSSAAAFRGTKTRTEAAIMRGNLVTGNSFFTHRAMAMPDGGIPTESEPSSAQHWFHPTDASQLFAGANPNVVSGNENLSVMKQGEVVWVFASYVQKKVMKQAEWKTYAPTDRQVNRVNFKRYEMTADASVLGTAAFDAQQSGAWGTYLNPTGQGGAFSIANFSACGKTCGKLVAGTTSDYLVSKPFAIDGTRGQNLYFLKYATLGGLGGGMRKAYVRLAAAPWDNLGLNLGALPLAPGQSVTDEVFFRSTASSNAAVLDLRGAVSGETYFSDLSLARVRSINFLDLKRVMSHVVNPGSQPMSFPCSALGLTTCDVVDEAGTRVGFPMVVAARSSRLLFARDPKWLE